jgi:hypothetical protein
MAGFAQRVFDGDFLTDLQEFPKSSAVEKRIVRTPHGGIANEIANVGRFIASLSDLKVNGAISLCKAR